MAKITSVLFIFALLVSSTSLVHSARTLISTPRNVQEKETGQIKMEDAENCHGLNEEECLMRRTLVAHTDYIYTQSHNP
ncbi:hypothetical protein KSS87_011196 [Heliosperma pusillum]|nr:hypothetical protein KSS87_004825 [Heliosperma pusillum]KAH9618458.1 hypothetical protein KSS87_011196 [Heliosperma pusillum]